MSVEQFLNSHHHSWIFDSKGDTQFTLVDFLRAQLPHIEENSWLERLDLGGIYINGFPIYADRLLSVRCRIEYYEPKMPLVEFKESFPNFNPDSHLLFEDDYLLAAFKPAGLPCKAAKEQRFFSLERSLTLLLKKKIHMPSRLDYSASGVVLVSKSPKTHAALQRLFERRHISKQYLLEVEGIVPWQQRCLAAPITKHSKYSFLRQVSAPLSGEGLAAVTRFKRVGVKTGQHRSLLAAFPLTGRTHQIRIHAAHLSFPIVGDCFYGGGSANSLHLLSYRWKLIHPISEKPLEITLPSQLVPGWAQDNSL